MGLTETGTKTKSLTCFRHQASVLGLNLHSVDGGRPSVFAVSASERLPYASPILYGTLPALLLLLIAAAGFLSYKHRAKRYEQRSCWAARSFQLFISYRSSSSDHSS